MVLVRPLGMIFPGATATISTVPMHAQTSATANTAIIVNAIARPVGEGGVSTISSAAGRNASSSLRRTSRFFGNSITFLADFMQPLRPLRQDLFLAPLDTASAGFVLEPIEDCDILVNNASTGDLRHIDRGWHPRRPDQDRRPAGPFFSCSSGHGLGGLGPGADRGLRIGRRS